MYGISEYLMLMHEVQRARLAGEARRAGDEPDERHEAVRHDGIIPKIKARLGRKARDGAESKGATR